MKKIGFLGNLNITKHPCSGQTIKTHIIATELQEKYGKSEMVLFDSNGKIRFLFLLPWILISLMVRCQNIVIMPAYIGARIIPFFLVLLNYIFKRRIHYVVIGGWLFDYVTQFSTLRWACKRLDCIYVETTSMLENLKKLDIMKVSVMPNCKRLNPADNHPSPFSEPYPLCTFSRVIPEKGIEEAIRAVEKCNNLLGHTAFTLSIYGKVDDKIWFGTVIKKTSSAIKYKGNADFRDAAKIIANYYMLLFPSYYNGEGFPGTLIDALAAGTPSIVSNWNDNDTIIEQGKTGFVVTHHSADAITDVLMDIYKSPNRVSDMRELCKSEAHKYMPENVMKILYDNII